MGLETIIQFDIIPFPEVILRVFLAMIFGLLLGIDRDFKNKPIDFRAYMIVALATCITAILSQELYQDYQSIDQVISLDLGKIIAGTLTGLGFLGAGAIIKVDGDTVVGTATGASIWASGIIGLALGFGFYSLAVICLVGISVILFIGGFFQNETINKTNNDKEN